MLTRILSSPDGSLALGGNYTSIPDTDTEARTIARQINRATRDLWDREAGIAMAEHSRLRTRELLDRLLGLRDYRHLTHVVYKRSAPFGRGDRYRPILHDLFTLFEDLRVVIVHRDPRASTASSYRRKFAQTLRGCALITEEQLTLLSAQVAALGRDRFLCFAYEDFCADPLRLTRRLAAHCGLPEAGLVEAVHAERVEPGRNERWRQELTPDEVAFLDDFFGDARRRQWPELRRS